MDYALQVLLNNINHSLICVVDGESINFKNGKDAITELQNIHKRFTLVGVSARDNTVVVTIKDATKEIEQQNKEFIAEHKRKFGYEPNLFDGI